MTSLYGSDVHPLPEPGTSGEYLDAFSIHMTVEALADKMRNSSTPSRLTALTRA